jgi:RNA-binding protein
MTTSNDDKKHLRRLGHNLKPVVMVAGNGLSAGVLKEAERAISDHELIKVKFAMEEREEKAAAISKLCSKLNAEMIQTIGHIALVYRKNPKADPKRSNVMR